MEVVPLHPRQNKDSVVAGLRSIADEIERGDYEFDPTFAVLVLAHESVRRDTSGEIVSYNWQTHALGEKNTYFTAKGILTAACMTFEAPES